MKETERRLLELYRRLSPPQQGMLSAFAEFLGSRNGISAKEKEEIPAPGEIPRPGKESVIKAIQRLSATYPMLDKGDLLHEANGLMSQHIMEGRAAPAVIDELEEVFRNQYEKLMGG